MTSRSGIVRAIAAKDFKAFTRDPFFLWMSIAGLIFYAALFWVLPDTVDETLTIGVVGFGEDTGEINEAGAGMAFVEYPDNDSLIQAIEDGGEVVVGMSLPTDSSDPTIRVYIGSGVPDAVSGAVDALAKEMAYQAVGIPSPVSGFATEQIVVGTDRAGDQVSIQEKFRPLLAFFVLMVESLALAALVAAEIQTKTVKAITVTPARVSDFLTAKVILGTLLAFSQVVILMIAIGSLGDGTLILLSAVFMGSIMVTGFALLSGSAGKDFIGIIFWSMLFMIPLLIPAISFMFPGSTASWIQVLPSYPLARVMVDVTSYGAGWAEAAPFLGVLAVWTLAALFTGWRVLEHRVRTL